MLHRRMEEPGGMDAETQADGWEGIADADRHLGRPFPLPGVVLPFVTWTVVRPAGPGAAEVEWNLDITREGARGRLALYAGRAAPGERPWDVSPQRIQIGDAAGEHRTIPLEEADEPALRPAHELRWQAGGLHLRLTAQGPWTLDELLAIGASLRA
jgi:hypothetical protein